MRMKLPREFYIPKASVKVADKLSDAVAYIYENATGKPYAAMFYGVQAKPVWHYSFKDAARREAAVIKGFADRREVKAIRAKWKDEAKAKAAALRATVQVGDLFHTCWGYDQTNVEFFEVVEVRGAYAVLREVAAASENNGPQDKCVPQSGAFLEPRYAGDDRGQPIRRLIQDGHIKIDDVRTAWPWGQRVAGVVVGAAKSRTADGWGH